MYVYIYIYIYTYVFSVQSSLICHLSVERQLRDVSASSPGVLCFHNKTHVIRIPNGDHPLRLERCREA